MTTQAMYDDGLRCKGKGFNCNGCKDKDDCVEYIDTDIEREKIMDTYKILLDKGFHPTYYTDANFFDSTMDNKSRLFYKLKIRDVNLLQIILKKLNKFNEYFWLFLINYDDYGAYIELDEELKSKFIYINHSDADNIEIKDDEFLDIVQFLPDKFNYTTLDE